MGCERAHPVVAAVILTPKLFTSLSYTDVKELLTEQKETKIWPQQTRYMNGHVCSPMVTVGLQDRIAYTTAAVLLSHTHSGISRRALLRQTVSRGMQCLV